MSLARNTSKVHDSLLGMVDALSFFSFSGGEQPIKTDDYQKILIWLNQLNLEVHGISGPQCQTTAHNNSARLCYSLNVYVYICIYLMMMMMMMTMM